MLYYNPNDSHLFINDRVGMNVTINLIRTAGKVIMGTLLVILLAMPFTGPALNIYYSKPVEIRMAGEEIAVSQGITNYTIKFEDIEKAELINELPKNLVRVYGTAAENLLKGKFRSGKENMTLLLRTDNPPFIKITKKNGEIFVLGVEGNVKGKFEEIEGITK